MLRRHPGLAYLLFVGVAGAAFAVIVLRDLRSTLIGSGDISLWVSQGAYVERNLTFSPYPSLDLVNDQTMYPYGTNQVFRPWGLERELTWTALYRAFAEGPWIQLYYLWTVLVTAVGAYVLLVRDYGPLRAALAGIAISFASYYPIFKFPVHLHIACMHWVVLGLVCDAVLVGRVWDRKPWSARLLLIRATLLMLSTGLDLAYVCAIGVVELSLSAIAAAVAAVARGTPTRWPQLRTSAGEYPVQCALLATALAAAAFLYVPLAAQVALATRGFDFSGLPELSMEASPWRLLLPILPYVNPVRHARSFADYAESPFVNSTGAAFLLAALVGVVTAPRRLLVMAPFLVLLAACLWGQPLLRSLPWLAYARTEGRWTGLYPAIFTILALQVPAAWLSTRKGRAVGIGIACLFAIELAQGYRLLWRQSHPVYHPDAGFLRFMQAVRASPGEAVMEWPFCVIGGNLVGLRELCPYFRRIGVTPLLAVFHGKKTVGYYFGRLHPDQIAPFRNDGWPALFWPDTYDVFLARHQTRDFTDHEWHFFVRFVREHDFGSIIVYPELLVPATMERFHATFGPTVVTAMLPDHSTFPHFPPIEAELLRVPKP